MGELEGIVQRHRDGHGFLISTREDLGDVYLPPQEMRSVMHRDRVKVRIVRYDRRGRPEGRIIEVLERRKVPIIGRLLHENGAWLVVPEDKRLGQDILVFKHDIQSAKAGQIVSVELTEPPSLHVQPMGRVLEVLGDVDDPGMEIEIAVRKYEVPHRFSDDALARAQKLPDRIRPVDRRDRVDLTDVCLITIDGEDARDFDDAVYCEPLTIGKGRSAVEGWRLIVAIADVSHYVKPGDPLDVNAYERATSVYFPRRVIPMLPEKLSNGLCSLNPQQDRLAMVCDMVIGADGEIQAYQFYPSVICSHARMTYTEAAAILANTQNAVEALKRPTIVPHLIHLHGVYRALLQARKRRGAIDFETTETQIVCNEQGRIERIVPRVRTEAHRLIEEAMLAANVCAADFINGAKQPVLLRVHEGPTPEKRVTLQNYLRALGLGLSIGDDPAPAEYQAIAQATKDRPDAQQIHMMLLRSMQQAIYTPINGGHFGLAYEAYAHFTSPIRRYPDLLVHRAIKAILDKKSYSLKLPLAGENQGQAAQKSEAWEIAGLHCSANERRADEASRDVEAWLKCKYMREHLGEEFGGTVSAATTFGLFVQLDELFVEGLVHVTELGGDYFRFDEIKQELRGDRTGIRYAVGTRLRVQVSRVDLDSRKIDFRLVRANEGPHGLALPSSHDSSSGGGGRGTGDAVKVLKKIKKADRAVKTERKASDQAGKSRARKTKTR
jgi:ribonuclease R